MEVVALIGAFGGSISPCPSSPRSIRSIQSMSIQSKVHKVHTVHTVHHSISPCPSSPCPSVHVHPSIADKALLGAEDFEQGEAAGGVEQADAAVGAAVGGEGDEAGELRDVELGGDGEQLAGEVGDVGGSH